MGLVGLATTVDWSSVGETLQSAWNSLRDFALPSGLSPLEQAALNYDCEQFIASQEPGKPCPNYQPRASMDELVARYQLDKVTKTNSATNTDSATDTYRAKRGTTVIGNYPQNAMLATAIGANWLNLPEGQWSWEINMAWLDAAIARGDKIVVATPRDLMEPKSTYAKEIEYLRGKGYE